MAEYKFPGQANLAWNQSFEMTTNTPAIAKRIWGTYADALAFANDINDTAIAGIILSVISDSDESKNGIYRVVKSAADSGAGNAKLEKVGAAGEISAVTIIEHDGDFYEAGDTEFTTPLKDAYGIEKEGVYIKVVSSDTVSYSLIDVDLSDYYTKGEADEKFVEKDASKGLSTNDYTDEDKAKLDDITEGATKVESSEDNGHITIDGEDVTVYEHPSYDEAEAAAVKVGRDANGHVVLGDVLGASDIKYNYTTTLAEAIEAIESDIEDINDPSDGILAQAKKYADEAFEESDGPFGKLVDAVDALDSSVQALELSVAGLDSSVAALESSVETLDSSVAALESSVETLDSSVQALDSSVSDLASSVDVLEEKTAGITIDPSTGKTSVDGVGVRSLSDRVILMDNELDKKIEVVKVNGEALEVVEHAVDIVIPAAAEYSIAKDASSGDFAAVYHLTKDGSVVGDAINIPKDYLVKSGSIVKGTWTGDTFVEDEAGADKALKFVVNVKEGEGEDEVIYINVKDLVDVYTGDSKTVSVSDSNVISVIMDESDGAVSYNKYKSEIAKRDASIAALDGEVKALDSSVQGLESSVAGLDSSVQGLESSVAALDSSVAAIEENLGDVDVTELDSRVETVEGTVEGISAVKGEGGAYDHTEIDGVNVSDLSSSVSALEDKTAGVQVDESDGNTTVDGIEIKGLASKVDGNSAAIAAILEKPAMGITDASIAAWDAMSSADVVNTIGGQSGAITLRGGQEAGENEAVVNLSMEGNEIQAVIAGLGTAAYQNATVFAAAEHEHEIADVSGLQDALDSKVDSTFTVAKVSLDDENNIDASSLRDAIHANYIDASYGEDDETLYISIS